MDNTAGDGNWLAARLSELSGGMTVAKAREETGGLATGAWQSLTAQARDTAAYVRKEGPALWRAIRHDPLDGPVRLDANGEITSIEPVPPVPPAVVAPPSTVPRPQPVAAPPPLPTADKAPAAYGQVERFF